MSDSNTILAKIRAHYDKIIAGTVVVLLLISLAYLGWTVGSVRKLQQQRIDRVTNLQPKFEFAEEVDVAPYDEAIVAVRQPDLLDASGWTNRMLFVPETRATCEGCGAPRPLVKGVCPWPWCEFDTTKVQEFVKTNIVVKADADEDGMLDEWETINGLDPSDPADAAADLDGDRFSNLEEFRAKTDPNQDKSRPPLFPDELVVDRINSRAFQMIFSSKSKSIDDVYSFGLNYRSGGQTMTKFVKVGAEFAGFMVAAFEPKVVEVTKPMKMKVDKSELTLKRGADTIVLVYREPNQDIDNSVVLSIPRIGKVLDEARQGNELEIDGGTYRVTTIDRDKKSVVLLRERDGREFTISDRKAEPQVAPDASIGE